MSGAGTLESALTRIALLEAEAHHRRELIDNRFDSAETAVRAALVANDKRLDALNELRGALTDQSDAMARRSEINSTIAALESKIFAELKSVQDKQDAGSRPNYLLAGVIVTAMISLIAGMWTVTGMKIDNAIVPLTVAQEQFRVGQVAQDREFAEIDGTLKAVVALQQTNTAKIGVSDTDRAQISNRLHDLEHETTKRDDLYHSEMSDVHTMITRLNVWADFLNAKVFPNIPSPPLKQP